MKLYNVLQFRKKIKEAFDFASQDVEVYVLRDDVVYKVCVANNQDKSKFTEAGIISKNPRPKVGEV